MIVYRSMRIIGDPSTVLAGGSAFFVVVDIEDAEPDPIKGRGPERFWGCHSLSLVNLPCTVNVYPHNRSDVVVAIAGSASLVDGVSVTQNFGELTVDGSLVRDGENVVVRRSIGGDILSTVPDCPTNLAVSIRVPKGMKIAVLGVRNTTIGNVGGSLRAVLCAGSRLTAKSSQGLTSLHARTGAKISIEEIGGGYLVAHALLRGSVCVDRAEVADAAVYAADKGVINIVSGKIGKFGAEAQVSGCILFSGTVRDLDATAVTDSLIIAGEVEGLRRTTTASNGCIIVGDQ